MVHSSRQPYDWLMQSIQFSLFTSRGIRLGQAQQWKRGTSDITSRTQFTSCTVIVERERERERVREREREREGGRERPPCPTCAYPFRNDKWREKGEEIERDLRELATSPFLFSGM